MWVEIGWGVLFSSGNLAGFCNHILDTYAPQIATQEPLWTPSIKDHRGTWTLLVTQSPTNSSDLMMTVLCRGGIAGAIALGGGAYYFMSGGKTKETLLHQNVVCRV